MLRELVYEDEIVRVYWDSVVKAVELEAKGAAATSTVFRASLERVLQVVKEKKATKLLADTAKMDKVGAEDLMWTETNWLPRNLGAGVKYIAVIPPESLVTHMSLDKMTERVDPSATGHIRRFFKDKESAREWLARQ